MSIHNRQTNCSQARVLASEGPTAPPDLFHGGDCGVAAKNASRLLQPLTSQIGCHFPGKEYKPQPCSLGKESHTELINTGFHYPGINQSIFP